MILKPQFTTISNIVLPSPDKLDKYLNKPFSTKKTQKMIYKVLKDCRSRPWLLRNDNKSYWISH